MSLGAKALAREIASEVTAFANEVAMQQEDLVEAPEEESQNEQALRHAFERQVPEEDESNGQV